jgi:1-acyl-sn-glycerol-3-phosphate acyltransferase
MVTSVESDPTACYRGRRIGWRPVYWLRFFYETAGPRRMGPLIQLRLKRECIASIAGLEHLPPDGPFVLAANHYSGRAAYDTVACALHAAARVRPDVPDTITLIAGYRGRHLRGIGRVISWPARKLVRWVFGRWHGRIIRIPLGNREPALTGLRDWRSHGGPCFVFPEGRASVRFGKIRDGAGLWLATFKAPVIPVGVWWDSVDGWQVRFGPPIVWTHRRELRDVQLGLALADRLPADLAPGWQDDLQRWHAAHAIMHADGPAAAAH